jgi:predicted nucleotidyltransferase
MVNPPPGPFTPQQVLEWKQDGPIIVIDPLPANLELVSASGTGWVCNSPPAQTVSCTRATSLAPGETAPTIVVIVNVLGPPFAVIENEAVVDVTDDIFEPDNVDRLRIRIQAGVIAPVLSTFWLAIAVVSVKRVPSPVTAQTAAPAFNAACTSAVWIRAALHAVASCRGASQSYAGRAMVRRVTHPAAPRQSSVEARFPAFLAELCRRLVASGAERVVLFGSYARGEADEDSDVDLVVIKPTDAPFFERLREAATCLEPEWPVDLLVYTPAEFERMRREGNAFAELIVEEGVVLHG